MSSSVAAVARRLVRWEYVPEAVLLIGLTAFFLDQTDAASSAFKSTKALLIMAAVTVGWLGTRVVLARLVRFAGARAAVFSVAAALALSVVVFPAYDNDTVIESFPAGAAMPALTSAPTTSTTAVASTPQATAQPAPTTTSMVAGAAAPPAAMPIAPPTAPPSTTTTTAVAPVETATAAPAETQPTQPVAAGPRRLRSGMFRGIDHRASGTVVIYGRPDGRYVVGLEDIDIQPGPDYDLYIVPGDDREDVKGGVRLDDLRGNRGTQFYEVPDGIDVGSGSWTVLVWCQIFAVPVAGATPA